MTSKSAKLAAKLTSKQRQSVREVLSKLMVGDDSGLDIKPLKGHKNIFRVRVGSYRIIFRREDKQVEFIGLSKRDDQTYRNL